MATPEYCNQTCPFRKGCAYADTDPNSCAQFRCAKAQGIAKAVPPTRGQDLGTWPKAKAEAEAPYRWQFPAITDGITNRRQLIKLKEEVSEVEDEALEVRFGHPGKKGVKRLAKELLNVIHACETWIRFLDLTEAEVEALRQAVEEDNRARGYYG